jgi:hypothetical protein
MAGHVFISHGSDNRSEAGELCAFIESSGVKAWIAPRDVRPGMDYSEELQKAIEGCVAFVVLVTDMANTSPYVRAETEMAFSNSKPIFPVRLSDIKPAAGLAFFLKIRHWTDAYGKDREASLARLAAELQTLGGVVPQAEAAPAAPPDPAPVPAPAPAITPAVPTPPPPPDDELLAAAIGPKADFYLARWRQADATGAKTSWSWAACLASIFWMAYRKMWLPLILFLAANLVLGVLGSAGPAMGRITLVASILLTFVTGYFGILWYRKHVARLIAGTAGLDREAALARLRGKGGVSRLAVWIGLGVVALLALLLVAAGVTIEARRQFDVQQEQLRQQQLRDHENAQLGIPPPETDSAAPADESQPQPEPEQPPAQDPAGY